MTKPLKATLLKVSKPTKTTNAKILVPRREAADIVLANTQVELKGAKIKIFGDSKNLLATFDSKTNTFKVNKKLMLGTIDIGSKMRDLEARIQKLES